ncbi:hypothetical protein [Nocardia seriolae]|nr:hypothetical protein [Nocardia seriolae]MTJ64740.1 hypothetical protein [Nocardia seriolae]MTK42699.1 hypothetical protein [Nocardia seriolae]QOW36526.1 hypothetical protein IMZ23_17725 [Nocardia seriolae]WNJ57002.1 hypothetical protein RMO66_26615 [Nocardia seriolae]
MANSFVMAAPTLINAAGAPKVPPSCVMIATFAGGLAEAVREFGLLFAGLTPRSHKEST